MYELLLRLETLLMGLRPPLLLGIGIPALVAGLVLWLGGTRYSTAIIGLLGAIVGSAAGLLVSQWLDLHVWLSTLVGAVVLAAISIALRNVLILVLAVLVVAGVSGGGYLAVVLDDMTTSAETQAPAGPPLSRQSFTTMDPSARLDYVNRISGEKEAFSERLAALLDDTRQALEPHALQFGLVAILGAVTAIALIWLIKTALIALAYSLVGTATLILGAQAALLGVGQPVVSSLRVQPLVLPATFLGMTVFGWLFQLLFTRRKPRKKSEDKPEESE